MVVLTLNIYNNIWSYYILGRLTLQEGEKLLDIRLRQEGFERCSGQPFTPRDGDCGVHAILHILCNIHGCKEYDPEEPNIFRAIVCQFFRKEVNDGMLCYGENLSNWFKKTSKPGCHVDYYFMTAAARMLEREIILLPTNKSSSTEIGRIIRISCEKTSSNPPIFIGYMEDTIFSSGHFQAIVPSKDKECPIADYVSEGIVPYPHRASKDQSILPSSFSLPEATRRRILSSISDSPPVHNSTKRPMEDDMEDSTFSKKIRLDFSTCHICLFRLKKNNKKSKCHCRKLVHHSCFLGDGSSCK